MADLNQNGTLIFTADEFENNPTYITELLSRIKFFPYACSFIDEIESFVMIGYSSRFRKLKFGEKAPEYRLFFNQDNFEDEIKVIDVKFLSLPKKDELPKEFHKRAKDKIIRVQNEEIFKELDTKVPH